MNKAFKLPQVKQKYTKQVTQVLQDPKNRCYILIEEDVEETSEEHYARFIRVDQLLREIYKNDWAIIRKEKVGEK